MSCKISSIPLFDKQAKRLTKKYPSLKNNLVQLVDDLTDNPEQGKALGNNFFKIRLAIASKGKGKSAGARVIPYFKIVESTIYMVSIYNKSETNTISQKELEQIFGMIP